MYKILWISLLLFTFSAANGEEVTNPSKAAENSTVSDTRKLISMPEPALVLMRKDMIDHLSTLNEIVGYLAQNKLEAAADVAEARLGRSSMGKYRRSGMGPGRYMPNEMRDLGWSMHDAATEFSKVAKQGDSTKAYQALQKVTSACVACHAIYRTR